MVENKSNNEIEAGKPVTKSDQLSETVDIQPLIRIIRGQHVMLDRNLAALYCVETKRLNEQVKRNSERFPKDFMFQLTKDEFENWKSQFATSKSILMGARKLPYAFTEQGIGGYTKEEYESMKTMTATIKQLLPGECKKQGNRK